MTSTRPPFRPFFIALACTVGLFAAAFWIPHEGIAATAGILSILPGVPICILLYRDGLRTQQTARPSTGAISTVLELPVRILGGLCLLSGVAILVWLAYNLLVERQPEFTGIRFAGQLFIPILLIVFGYRWLRRPLGTPDE